MVSHQTIPVSPDFADAAGRTRAASGILSCSLKHRERVGGALMGVHAPGRRRRVIVRTLRRYQYTRRSISDDTHSGAHGSI